MSTKKKIIAVLITILMVVYYYNPYKIEAIGLYDKVWAHRINSKEKLDSALKYFNGIELDLVYNSEKDFLDVNHPPTASIGLRFDEYLKGIKKDYFPYIWLDIKNLNQKNSKLILAKLLRLFNAKNYPLDKILIESKKTDALLLFEKSGFKTSFYLPSELYKKDSLMLLKRILEIKKVIKKQPNMAISTHFKDYEIIKKEFPNHPKYIWATVRPIHFNHFKIRKILKDETVKVVLLKYHVIIGNR
jgi:hypothetical protein